MPTLPNGMVFYFSLITLVIGIGLGASHFLNDRDLTFDIGKSDLLESEREGLWLGSFTLRNNSQDSYSVVGMTETCQFRCSSAFPVILPPSGTSSFEVSVRVPESKYREKFTSGLASFFVESESTSGTHLMEVKIPWGVYSF